MADSRIALSLGDPSIVLAIVLLGGNPLGDGAGSVLDDLAGQTAGTGPPAATLKHCQTGQDTNEHEDCRILAVVNSVQEYWSKALRNYEPARTRFFDGAVSTGCGSASSAVGPFYCPLDRYAGAWVANAVRTGLIEEITRADVQDALSAAAAVGDDRIQERMQGRVTPESWTHGSAERRQSWFVRGLEGGTPSSCDTFSGRV